MPYNGSADAEQRRGHTRNRSQNGNGSGDSTRSRSSKQPSQKAMLSRALQKANAAVQLDNAGKTDGASEAYKEACELLQQVLLRTSGDEDRRKLEAIRKTYTSRIDELGQLPAARRPDSRPLPPEPLNELARRFHQQDIDDGCSEDGPYFGHAPSHPYEERSYSRGAVRGVPAQGRMPDDSAPSSAIDMPRYGDSLQPSSAFSLQSSFSRPHVGNQTSSLAVPLSSRYMPAPLSPRRPSSPSQYPISKPYQEEAARRDMSTPVNRSRSASNGTSGHARGNSNESISWLDPIDESGGSTSSSVHSRSSSMGVRRKPIRPASGDTEAEFDAALDDAIEAAYDDGYEPMDPAEMVAPEVDDGEDIVAKALRKVEMARERVRATQQEALALASERERRLREQLETQEQEEYDAYGGQDGAGFYDGSTSDDEEEDRQEAARSASTGNGAGHETRRLATDTRLPSTMPRESDSSEFTSRTWHSSQASNPPTASTEFSSVSSRTAGPSAPSAATSMMPPPPPPSGSLPQIPAQAQAQVQARGAQMQIGGDSSPTRESVRDRRLSGQKPKQLKIETSRLNKAPEPLPQASSGPNTAFSTGSAPIQHRPAAGYIVQQRQALSAGPNRAPAGFLSSRHAPSPTPGVSPGSGITGPTPPLPQGVFQGMSERSDSPSLSRSGLRENFSTTSLRSMKSRNMSLTALDDTSDMSPGTPLSNQYGAHSKAPAMPSLPASVATMYKDRATAAAAASGGGSGGLHLFDDEFHSPSSPGSPNPSAPDGPVALEPCPIECTLRPFWLMRCIYQTLVNPRGGYVSSKLFVPREVWRVKGVKLKNLEDKIGNCDYLTAALLKLAKVDTCDADAVLEEMQSLEVVLEQVQATLSRKLGSEVGVQSGSSMFKDATTSSEADGMGDNVPRSTSVTGKSNSFSWRRKLRPKNSSAGLSGAYSSASRKDSIPDGSRGGPGMPSLPMTAAPTSKPVRRDVTSVQFTGPNAHYMGSLARLMDAAQSIDQIARQVEDPGLRHADKTQVGLELCTRHAAEFFAFYICRFVLGDISTLLDKFVKRGSEWVLT